jgi:hypothetical protein
MIECTKALYLEGGWLSIMGTTAWPVRQPVFFLPFSARRPAGLPESPPVDNPTRMVDKYLPKAAAAAFTGVQNNTAATAP